MNIQNENFLSFAPSDISIYMYNVKIGNCLSVNYSIQREVIALFAFGDPNAQGFNRGKRGIAGSLVFNVFQNHPILRSGWAQQVNITEDSTLGALGLKNSEAFQQGTSNVPDQFGATTSSNPIVGGTSVDLSDANLRAQLGDTYNAVARRAIKYADQLPPFDIVLTFVNETGDAAVMVIEGCIIGNEAGGYSVDDITSEMAFTFIARSISPLQAFYPANTNLSNGRLDYTATSGEKVFKRSLGL